MTEATGSKKSSGWKVFGIIAGALVLCAVALVITVSAIGSAKGSRLEAAARARILELKSASILRPTLRGSAEPGNAWDDYAPALDEVKAFPNANKLFELVRREPKADPELGKAALTGLAKAIDGIHRGAGRAGSRFPYEWEKGAAMSVPNLLPSSNMANLLVLKARALSEEGKGREAAGVLLDVLQFGRDLAGDGILISEMLGFTMMSIGMSEVVDQLAAEKFDKPALEDLDRGLAALEGSLPNHAQTLKTDILLFGGPGRCQHHGDLGSTALRVRLRGGGRHPDDGPCREDGLDALGGGREGIQGHRSRDGEIPESDLQDGHAVDHPHESDDPAAPRPDPDAPDGGPLSRERRTTRPRRSLRD